MITTRIGIVATALLLAACTATPPPATSPTVSRSEPRLSGASLGTVLGGRGPRGDIAAAAGVRPMVSPAATMDRMERDLRARTAESGVDVVRQGYNLDLRMRSGIAFDFNASTVRAPFRRTLDDVAQTLAGYPSTFVDITGHTDSVGTDAVNQALSDQRAQAVADYLGRLGVNRGRIATRGFGKTKPVASNADEAGRAQNRRVEIHISPIVEDDVRGGRRY